MPTSAIFLRKSTWLLDLQLPITGRKKLTDYDLSHNAKEIFRTV
jgi:hypothetical protein